jgi:thioredoxin 1
MSEFDELIKSEKLTLVDFFSDWCGPCRMMNPIIGEISNEMKEETEVIKVDVDASRDLAIKYNVRGIPTFILFKNGEPIWRQSGAISKQVLVEKINQFKN